MKGGERYGYEGYGMGERMEGVEKNVWEVDEGEGLCE